MFLPVSSRLPKVFERGLKGSRAESWERGLGRVGTWPSPAGRQLLLVSEPASCRLCGRQSGELAGRVQSVSKVGSSPALPRQRESAGRVKHRKHMCSR